MATNRQAGSFDLSKTLQSLSGITEHIKDDGRFMQVAI
jgi:hypothetical protein